MKTAMRREHLISLCLGVLTGGAFLAISAVEAQDAPRAETGFLPPVATIRPLIADPTEPQLGGSLRAGKFTRRSLEAVASIGATFPLAGFASSDERTVVQIAGSGGVTARFDLHATGGIVTEDYIIALPLYIRSGSSGARLRIVHRSAHIGDEYVERHPDYVRFDLSYESLEAILMRFFGGARAYLGGDYQVHNATTPIEPGTLRGGADFVSSKEFGSGSLRGRWVAGIDFNAARDLGWRVAKSVVGGAELTRVDSRFPSLRIVIELFSGPTTVGQFYGKSERYIGLAGYITQ